jgi:hypothetical protein
MIYNIWSINYNKGLMDNALFKGSDYIGGNNKPNQYDYPARFNELLDFSTYDKWTVYTPTNKRH